MRFDETITIATPEGVDLELTLAGAGSRFVSALVDLAIQTALLIATFVAVGLLTTGASTDREGLAAASFALISFLVVFAYDVLFEVLAAGRTPGKRLNGLRVVRSAGSPSAFSRAPSETPCGWSTSFRSPTSSAPARSSRRARTSDSETWRQGRSSFATDARRHAPRRR